MNETYRQATIPPELYVARMLAATAPEAPEASCREVAWVYGSNFDGVYAGDNDYFFDGHDLRENGHLIDPKKTPVFVLSGEYDLSMLFEGHGGQAVADHTPGVVHRVLPGLGHFAPADDPVRFCEAIIPILDEVLSQCS